MFLGLPLISVITNIEYDHPDFFVTPEVYTQAFADLPTNPSRRQVAVVCG